MKVLKLFCLLTVTVLCNSNIYCIPIAKKRNLYQVEKKKEKKEKEVIKDSDGDGVPDDVDECPFIRGLPQFNGCPDSDGDGIPDLIDDCPHTRGLPQFKGCPDSDGDGVPDNDDVCPLEKGDITNNGCPSTTITINPPAKNAQDTTNFDVEMKTQIERFEKYVSSQEVKKLDYYNYYNNPQTKPNNSVGSNMTDEIEDFWNNDNGKNGTASENIYRNVAATTSKTTANKVETLSVTINSSRFNYLIPELESIINDLKFAKGRMSFIDETKSYEALNKIAALFNKYPEWSKLTFYLHSNNEIEGLNNLAFRTNQLFHNREETLKSMLTKKLNALVRSKLHFNFSMDYAPHISSVPNYIRLNIEVANK